MIYQRPNLYRDGRRLSGVYRIRNWNKSHPLASASYDGRIFLIVKKDREVGRGMCRGAKR